jgi:hypothetical protein
MMSQIRLLLGLAAWMSLSCVAGAQNPQPALPQETHPPLAPPIVAAAAGADRAGRPHTHDG